MSANPASFWDEYRHIVAEILTPLIHTDGVAEQHLLDAETRLGIQIPSLLREFYLRTGGREDINDGHDNLLPPKELKLSGQILIFYDPHQSIVLYGVDLRSEDAVDPAVLMAENGPHLEWEVWHQRLSGFLFQELFWQSVNGGMPYVGIGTIRNEQLPEVPNGWEGKTLDGELQKAFALFRDGQILLVWGTLPQPEISGGGRTRNDLVAVQKTFGAKWDYSSLEDE